MKIVFERKINYYETDVTNKAKGETVMEAETKHCFTNNELKPISIKKYNSDLYEKLQNVKI